MINLPWQTLMGVVILFGLLTCSSRQQPANHAPEVIDTQQLREDRGQLVLAAALRGIGRKYGAHVLDAYAGEERLVIDTLRPDCWTFTEYCLAHAIDPGRFEQIVQQLRYRRGEINGYASRIHYFTEWAQQAVSQGFVEDLTQQLGGKSDQRIINYITRHPTSYAKCSAATCMQQIAAVEKRITSTERYLIPIAQVAKVEELLKDGDIVGITTHIKGLDVVHQGIIARGGDQAFLVHASSEKGKVVQTTERLSAYLQNHKQHSGIVVLRPL